MGNGWRKPQSKMVIPDPEEKRELIVSDTALLSELSLAEDWNRPEEDEAWSYLQGVDFDNDQANKAMNREAAAYRRLHPQLKQKYLDEFVAIYEGKLVDHDNNQVELYLRIKTRYPGKFVWIAPVRQEPEEAYTIHSPRFAGDV
jgi:hypothetical protein